MADKQENILTEKRVHYFTVGAGPLKGAGGQIGGEKDAAGFVLGDVQGLPPFNEVLPSNIGNLDVTIPIKCPDAALNDCTLKSKYGQIQIVTAATKMDTGEWEAIDSVVFKDTVKVEVTRDHNIMGKDDKTWVDATLRITVAPKEVLKVGTGSNKKNYKQNYTIASGGKS